jgi:hypothetical protein
MALLIAAAERHRKSIRDKTNTFIVRNIDGYVRFCFSAASDNHGTYPFEKFATKTTDGWVISESWKLQKFGLYCPSFPGDEICVYPNNFLVVED